MDKWRRNDGTDSDRWKKDTTDKWRKDDINFDRDDLRDRDRLDNRGFDKRDDRDRDRDRDRERDRDRDRGMDGRGVSIRSLNIYVACIAKCSTYRIFFFVCYSIFI